MPRSDPFATSYRRRRYHGARDRRHSQRRQQFATWRRRCGWSDPSCGGTGVAGGMPGARRLPDRRREDHRQHRLSVRHIIHTVGPVWRGGGEGEPDLLTSCYRRCLELARTHQCATIAFPAISTGVYGYPKDQAAHVAVTAVAAFLSESDMPGTVIFCCFDAQTADLHRGAIASLRSK